MPAGRGTRTSRRRRRRRLPSPQQSQIKPKRILRARGALSTSMWTTRVAYLLSSGVFALRDLRSRLEVVLAWERDSGSKVPSLNALLKAPEPQRKVDFGYPHLAPPTLNLSLTCQSLMLAQSTRHKYQSGEVSSTTGSVRGHQRGQRPGGEFEPGGRGRS